MQINVADIAEIDKDKTLQPPGAIKKRRAGGGVPPWGRQSAARPGGAELRRVGHLDASAEVAKGAKILAIDLCILLQIFFGGVFRPPYNPPQEASAFRWIGPSGAQNSSCFGSKFRSIFDVDVWSIWGRFGRQVGVILGTFGGQDRSRSVQNAS